MCQCQTGPTGRVITHDIPGGICTIYCRPYALSLSSSSSSIACLAGFVHFIGVPTKDVQNAIRIGLQPSSTRVYTIEYSALASDSDIPNILFKLQIPVFRYYSVAKIQPSSHHLSLRIIIIVIIVIVSTACLAKICELFSLLFFQCTRYGNCLGGKVNDTEFSFVIVSV